MFFLFSLLSVIYIGCATTPSSQQEAVTSEEIVKYVANFDYTPASQAAPNSAGITFAVGKTTYKSDTKVPWIAFPQFDNLDKTIEQDLSKLLTAKGFSVRGPFDSYDLIPFSDKQAVDLYLSPTMELSVILEDQRIDTVIESNFALLYATANVKIRGKINLELREIVTRELMWTKNIPLTKFEFPYRARTYPGHPSYDYKIIMNDVAKGIEQQYPNLMTAIYKSLAPKEMRIIKKQCQELKNKK